MHKGQSLVEVIFAIGLSALVLLAVVSLASRAVKTSSFSADKATATKFTQEAIEWIRRRRDYDWNELILTASNTCPNPYCTSGAQAETTWCLNAASLVGMLYIGATYDVCSSGSTIGGNTVFSRKVKFVCSDDDPPSFTAADGCNITGVKNVEATVIVTWSDSNGVHSVDTTTRLTKWKI